MKELILSALNRVVSTALILAVLTVYSTPGLALPGNKSLMGELVVTGKRIDGNNPFVVLNGEHANSGNTVFSSSTIATTESSSAKIELGELGYVSLPPNSVISLTFDEKSISGNLSAGTVKIFNSEGISVKIKTPNGIINNEFDNPASGVTEASAEENSSSAAAQQTQPSNSTFPYVLFGVTVVIAATVLAAAASGGAFSDDDGQIIVSSTR